MKVTFEINEEKLAIKIEEELVQQILSDSHNAIITDARHGIKTGTDKAIKEYIYANKDKIIEKVIDRATTEIVRKGIPKLLERMEEKQ